MVRQPRILRGQMRRLRLELAHMRHLPCQLLGDLPALLAPTQPCLVAFLPAHTLLIFQRILQILQLRLVRAHLVLERPRPRLGCRSLPAHTRHLGLELGHPAAQFRHLTGRGGRELVGAMRELRIERAQPHHLILERQSLCGAFDLVRARRLLLLIPLVEQLHALPVEPVELLALGLVVLLELLVPARLGQQLLVVVRAQHRNLVRRRLGARRRCRMQLRLQQQRRRAVHAELAQVRPLDRRAAERHALVAQPSCRDGTLVCTAADRGVEQHGCRCGVVAIQPEHVGRGVGVQRSRCKRADATGEASVGARRRCCTGRRLSQQRCGCSRCTSSAHRAPARRAASTRRTVGAHGTSSRAGTCATSGRRSIRTHSRRRSGKPRLGARACSVSTWARDTRAHGDARACGRHSTSVHGVLCCVGFGVQSSRWCCGCAKRDRR